ncbi:MAG: hypothetical protein AAF639_15100 [Chloroflexota bacterium]
MLHIRPHLFHCMQKSTQMQPFAAWRRVAVLSICTAVFTIALLTITLLTTTNGIQARASESQLSAAVSMSNAHSTLRVHTDATDVAEAVETVSDTVSDAVFCRNNISWVAACDLTLSSYESIYHAMVDQHLNQAGQSRWYKFKVEPDSKLILQLTNLPANYDLSLYKDISVAMQELLAADSAEDLELLGAEFAPDAFSPDAFSPDAFSPDAFSPDAFSPDAFSPDAFSPDAFSPDAFSPDAFSPDAFSPDAFSPDAFSPDAFSPDAFSPDAFSPDAFSPDAFSPDAFSPDAFSPDAFSPDAFSPDAFSPDAFSPDAFSPDAFSPDAFSPDAFSPDAFSPDAFSPDAFSPDAFSPDAFSPDAFSEDEAAPDAFSPDAFSPDAFSPDAFSPDAFSEDEAAPDAFSPDAFSPDAFSPDAFSPDAFSEDEAAPDAFSPDAFSPDAFSEDEAAPDAFSPDAFSPDAFSEDEAAPDAFSPDAFSEDEAAPDAFSPDAFSEDESAPDAFSPDAFSPDAFSPDAFSSAFSSAQMMSVLSVSAFRGTISEGIFNNTWDQDGYFYIRVRGRNGVHVPDAHYHLDVAMVPGVCSNISSDFPASSLVAEAGNFNTLILADWGQLQNQYSDDEIAPLLASLDAFAARPEIAGTIIDVSQDARVAAARQQANANPICPYAQNLLAYAIKDVVAAYRAVNPVQYVVLVGNDDNIPFFRHPDQANLANERNYVVPVLNNTPSQASLKNGYFLSQDRYGTLEEVSVNDDTLPVFDLAVGRLVETPAEMAGVVDAYLSTDAGVVDTPQSALVSGYDFLEDSANAVLAELEAGIGSGSDTNVQSLIMDGDLSPQHPSAWTGSQLKSLILDTNPDIMFLAGHFSAGSLLAADYSTRMIAADFALTNADLFNALVYSGGCHSGYNVVNHHGISNLTPEPDWAQTFARKQATFIGGTGYQYGDTDFIEYSERLYLLFTKELRVGSGPIAVGDAMVAAKQRYLSELGTMRPIHEKSLLQATIFGLPMIQFDLPNRSNGDSDADNVIISNQAVEAGPGAVLGMQVVDMTITPSHIPDTVQLSDTESETTIEATYLTGNDGLVVNPAEPALPLEQVDVVAPEGDSAILRGVGFRSASYDDHDGIIPLTGAATTEIRGVHVPFHSSVFYPVQPWGINYFDAIFDEGEGGEARLNVTTAQFRSNDNGDVAGVLREYDDMGLRLFFSEYIEGAALVAPPAISNILAESGDGSIAFSASVQGNPNAGIQEVWVTFTSEGNDALSGQWQSINLIQDETETVNWSGELALDASVVPNNVRYIVQAVNGLGLVTVDTNLGAYHQPDLDASEQMDAASEVVQAAGHRGASGTSGTNWAFTIAALARTHATEQTALVMAPGSATGDGSSVEVNTKAETQSIIASLLGDNGRALTNHTVIAKLTKQGVDRSGGPGAASIFMPLITDYSGNVLLSAAELSIFGVDAGDYDVDLFFSSAVPMGDGTMLDLRHDLYAPAFTQGTLQVVDTHTYFIPFVSR